MSRTPPAALKSVLLNTPEIELWPAGLLRARSNHDARALARARRVLRRKRDGAYLAADLQEGLPAPPVQMGGLDTVTVGQRVYSVGSPRGLELTIAEGLVSGLRQEDGIPLPVIQTSAPLSPGSSGGGLFDEYGRVIGITTKGLIDSQNLNFAMPVELINVILEP